MARLRSSLRVNASNQQSLASGPKQRPRNWIATRQKSTSAHWCWRDALTCSANSKSAASTASVSKESQQILAAPGGNHTQVPAEVVSLQERILSGTEASTSSPVADEVQPNRVEELISSGKTQLNVDEIASAFNFPLDNFQLQASREFLEGHSVVVCAPTGAGKTAIAEAATIAVLARGQRIIYTTPLKALSNQKLQEMRCQFGRERVGLQTGDACLNAEGDVVVMTTEVLRNILFRTAADESETSAAEERMRGVGLVVLDEVHYLGDPDRGSVWEEVIIGCPQHIPLLCMSATVSNPDDLGGWITKVHGSCKTVVTNWRPVPLAWNFCHTLFGETRMVPLLNGKGSINPYLQQTSNGSDDDDTAPRGFGSLRVRKRRRGSRAMIEESPKLRVPSIEEALQALKSDGLLPSIWFTFSRIGCDNAALRLHTQEISLASPRQRETIAAAVEELQRDQPEAVREAMLPPLLEGIASHHAGCLPAWKSMIEDLYKKGVIKVVFATGTLAAGINMPARSTVISSISRRVSTGHITLKHNELLQMAGRAGRRGFDTQGHCVVLQDRFDEPNAVVDILKAGPEPLQSHFATGYGMVLRLLHHRTLESARSFVERSFYNYLADEGLESRKQAVKDTLAEAEALLKQAVEAEEAAGGAAGTFKDYLKLKKEYQAAAQACRVLVRAGVRSRGKLVTQMLLERELPVVVGLEYTTLDSAEESQILPALLVHREDKQIQDQDLELEMGCSYLCLSADNRLFQVQAKHVAAISADTVNMGAADIQPVISAAAAVPYWQHLKSSSYIAQGTGLTASIAARISDASLEQVQISKKAQAMMCEAQEAMNEAKERAEAARSSANLSKTHRPDLQLRAEATKLKRKAKEMRAALNATSFRKGSNWRSFESTLGALISAGALDAESLQATPLGQVAREINSENELWLAVVLTHSAVQTLSPAELASVVSAMVAGETPSRPNIQAQYECSTAVLQAIEGMELDRERLFHLQVNAGITSSLTVDIRLAGVVEAWTSGATWEQVMADCSLDGGDVARLLSRTTDVLRQASRCTNLLPTMRDSARIAASAMSRKPITDLIQ